MIGKLDKKRIIILLITLLLIVSVLVLNSLLFLKNTVTILDNDNEIVVETSLNSPKKILKSAGLKLSTDDEYDVITKDEEVTKIIVRRAFTVTLTHDGVSDTVNVTGGKVSDILDMLDVSLGTQDTLSEDVNDELTGSEEIILKRVQYVKSNEIKETDYKTITNKVQTVPKGKTVVITDGEKGQTKETYEAIYVDGNVAQKTLLKSEVLSTPITKVVKTGVGGVINGRNYSYYIDMKASAYTISDGGGVNAVTSTGKTAQYGCVAVDPSVIPLGTKLYIAKGNWIYGDASAEDTGGSIKGNKIDLFFKTRQEALNFGRRTVRVYILE